MLATRNFEDWHTVVGEVGYFFSSRHYMTPVAAVAGGIQACTEDGTVPQIIRQRKLSATAALTLQL